MKPNNCYAYFALRGFPMTPEEVSAALGLKPSKSWRAGDPHSAHRIPGKKRESSFWSIESRLDREAPVELEDHVKDVLDQLAPCFDTAAALSKKHAGLMELVGLFYQGYPGLGFSVSTVQQLAALQVEIDCDFYHLVDAKPNKAPEPTTVAVTSRAPSSTSRASHGRGSS